MSGKFGTAEMGQYKHYYFFFSMYVKVSKEELGLSQLTSDKSLTYFCHPGMGKKKIGTVEWW